MDIRIAQVNPTVGALTKNAEMILSIAQQNNDADIIIFPECVLSGYPIEDLGLNESFQKEISQVADKLNAELLQLDVATVYGTPYLKDENFFNALFFVDTEKKSVSMVTKTDLPNYGVFDEKRVFTTRANASNIVKFRDKSFACLICEDGWNGMISSKLSLENVDAIIWINGSPYEKGKFSKRVRLAENMSTWSAYGQVNIPVVYANLVGGEDELVFDGKSFFLDNNNISIMSGFKEEIKSFVSDLDIHIGTTQVPVVLDHQNDIQEVYQALVLGTRDYLNKQNFKSVVLGYSGGVDSGIVAAIACDAIGSNNVHLVRLPSKFSSAHSLSDAEEGAMRLEAILRTIYIEPVVESLRIAYWGTQAGVNNYYWKQQELSGIADENIQARARGTLLMAISNQEGHILLTTGNKSEVSVGYSTLYGDMNGGFNPIKDCYKTLVWDLCRYRNNLNQTQLSEFGYMGVEGVVVPEEIINKPPSAELSEGQFDSNSLPEYPVLDAILEKLIDFKWSTDQIVQAGIADKTTVDKIAGLVYRAEYKRRQAAPGVKITSMLHGRDRRVPIVNMWRK